MPRQTQPETPVFPGSIAQKNAAYVLIWRLFQSEGPVPFVSAFYCWKSNIAFYRWKSNISIERECSIARIGPGNGCVQEPDNLPLWKEQLSLRCIGKLKRAQEKTICFEARDHEL